MNLDEGNLVEPLEYNKVYVYDVFKLPSDLNTVNIADDSDQIQSWILGILFT